MKRSEMLKIIKTCIKLNHFDEANQYARAEISLGRFAEIVSETILKRMEKEGMAPPKITVKDPGHFTGDSFEYRTNEWEDEDETK